MNDDWRHLFNIASKPNVTQLRQRTVLFSCSSLLIGTMNQLNVNVYFYSNKEFAENCMQTDFIIIRWLCLSFSRKTTENQIETRFTRLESPLRTNVTSHLWLSLSTDLSKSFSVVLVVISTFHLCCSFSVTMIYIHLELIEKPLHFFKFLVNFQFSGANKK